MANQPEWQNAYEAAVLEVDNSKLLQRANDAEVAVFQRLQILTELPCTLKSEGP